MARVAALLATLALALAAGPVAAAWPQTPTPTATPTARPADMDDDDGGTTGSVVVGLLVGAALGAGGATLLARRRRPAPELPFERPAAEAPASPPPALTPAQRTVAGVAPPELVIACIEVADQLSSDMLREQLHEALAEAGVRPVRADGERFNRRRHRSMGSRPTDDPASEGIVAGTQRVGWANRERALRKPDVIVYRYTGGPADGS